MKSREGRIVIALNIDCENVKYVWKKIEGYDVIVPVGKAGRLKCNSYEESGTTNGRFIFQFRDLNENWGREKYLSCEILSFRRFDIVEPVFRVTQPEMAIALDSACESVITSAVAGRKVGERVRSYSATDFMAREQAEQALLKMRVYEDMGLEDKLIFFVVNTGYIGRHDLRGFVKNEGEKIRVEDTKKLIYLVEKKKIRKWLRHPAFGYMVPDPAELNEHGLKNFGHRFNPLRFYGVEEIIEFIKRDIAERTNFLKNLFEGWEKELHGVINVWKRCRIPSEEEILEFYEKWKKNP